MRGYASSVRFIAGIIGIGVSVASCATPQPQVPVAHDEADRLFLKLVEVTRRPSPPIVPDIDEMASLVKQIPASGDTCMSKNMTVLMQSIDMLGDLADSTVTTNWVQVSANMRQKLKHLQTMPFPEDGCDGRAFPQVQID